MDGSFWLQIDMFRQTKIAIIVATRYVFWADGMPKMLLWLELCLDPAERAYSTLRDLVAAVSRYILTLLAYDRVLVKCFWGPTKTWKTGKVLEFL